MNDAARHRPRRTAQSDPRLGHRRLFDADINAQLAAGLPQDARQAHFTRATMPDSWLEAVLENQPSYRAREKSVAIDLRGLPASMRTEFAWSIERQVQLGMRIQAQNTTKLTRQIALVLTDPEHARLSSLTDLPHEDWLRAIRKSRIRIGEPLAANQMAIVGRILARAVDLLVHVYHRGPWWELNVWNPLLDTRISLREHEPRRNNLIYFSHLITPWLREAAKWWLSRQLERGVYTWSTAFTRQVNLCWFQRYLDVVGCDGPHLVDDPRRLGQWVQGFRQWLNQQRCTAGANKGEQLGQIHRRAAMTGLEQLYRFVFEERDEAAEVLAEDRWRRLGPQHAVLFRYGDKPTGPKAPPPDAVLSDAVISRIAEHSGLLAQPQAEGGFADEQLVRIVGLLIKTGRRISEITLLDYDPVLAVPFPDPDGSVARLRYQQTKIITEDSSIPIDQETLDLIRQQQEYACTFMTGQNRPGVDPKYLFLAERNNRNGDRPYPSTTARPRLTKFAAAIDLRDGQDHLIKISKTHTFRHTRATSLLNAGVPLHVAMRYMGHKTPVMFLHYARTLSTTAEREFLRYKKITADGRPYDRDPREMFEALALDQRTDRILPNGYCALPPRQVCDKGNACLSCTKFVTDATFADTLQQQREETAKLIDRRQHAHVQRFGQPMTDDNVWLRGRTEEVAALDGVLLAIDRVRHHDGTTTAVRGAGAPQRRLSGDTAAEHAAENT
ncbi:tyrosine-type recombinase/integrase [Streptomyces fuscichromogenes]|uniref:Transposase/integrase n=1 Tax=Streptomyces fuscichromogenes TaxID=1324013 RepID=A0A917XQN6_9ACTN|nr:site-specific integrase [Streptomyces fuscichromogenes]GGN46085.1 putative transposase/integrase [Streptomyces fuscichromogenes]